MRFRMWRECVTRAFVALVGGFLCVGGWAQTPTKPRPDFHFDIRRLAALTGQAGDQAVAAESKVAERRRVAAVAAGQPGGPGAARLRWNRFGLPKVVVHPDGVTPPGAQGDPLTAARNYLQSQSALFPFSQDDLENLRTTATGRSGGLTFLTLTQTRAAFRFSVVMCAWCLTAAGR